MMRIDDRLSDADQRIICDGLVAFSDRHTAPRNYRPLRLALRDEEGRVVGGLLGSIVWDWLQIDALWVEEGRRGQSLGTRLLDEAERRAVQLGCRQARLDTLDFEARPFYEKHGYKVYGALEGFPSGHAQFHLRKVLRELPGEPTSSRGASG